MEDPKESHQPIAVTAGLRRRHLPLALVLAAGVVLSIALFWVLRGKERERLQAEFERRAGIPAAELQRDIDDHLSTLRSIGYFFVSSVEVDRGEFRSFTKDDLARLPGIRAFEWAPRVPEAARAGLEKSAGADGRKYKIDDQIAPLDQFRIQERNSQGLIAPAPARAEYFPIYFLEPAGENLTAFGLDLASDPACRQAMEASRDQGEPTAAAPYPLGGAESGMFAYRVFMAIYTNGVSHQAMKERRENLAGYATVVVHMRKLIEASITRMDQGRDIRIIDLAVKLVDENANPERTLYQSSRWRADGRVDETTLPLLLAGRRCQLHIQPTGRFVATHRTREAFLTLGFGLLFTVMLGGYLFNVSGRTAQVGELVIRRTADLALSNEKLKNEMAERERAQQAIAEQCRLVDTLMDNIPDHIYFKDRQSRFLRISKAMAGIFDLKDPKEAEGRSDFDFFTAEHAQRAFDDEQEIIKTGAPLIGREEKETWPDGSVTWVSTTKQAMRAENGTIVGTFGISRDITARKMAEEALEQKAIELLRSNRELEQFAYVASHDLQEPLRMIASYTQLLERRYKEKLDQNATEYIAFAVDGARRMQVLINDLLTYSRVDRCGKPFAAADCTAVLQSALLNLKVSMEETGAIVTHGALPRLTGDATQLAQLFQNLIGNSIKFRNQATPEIHITAELRKAPEPQQDDRTAGEWMFTVRDNGIGIESQYYERIFVIFQRLHPRDQYPGTGIGLALCKKIIERHGGRIWVESTPAKGSTFCFTIPQNAASCHEQS